MSLDRIIVNFFCRLFVFKLVIWILHRTWFYRFKLLNLLSYLHFETHIYQYKIFALMNPQLPDSRDHHAAEAVIWINQSLFLYSCRFSVFKVGRNDFYGPSWKMSPLFLQNIKKSKKTIITMLIIRYLVNTHFKLNNENRYINVFCLGSTPSI